MTSQDIATYRKRIKSIGPWAGVRMLRNKGLRFDQAYFIMFDRLPRVI